MAQSPISRVVQTPLQCTPDDFYKFFKEEANKLPEVCGSIVQKIELADGNKSWLDTVGSRKRIYIVTSPGSSENVKYEVVDINDQSKKIIFNVLDGAMLQNYTSFKVTFEVTAGSTAKWTVEYVKISACSPDPDVYLNMLPDVNNAVNTYLRYRG